MINPQKILECFGTDFIAVRNLCDGVTSSSGFYLDDYVGIDIESLAKVATGVDATGSDFFDRILRVSIVETVSKFIDLMLQHGKIQLLHGSIKDSCVRLKSNQIMKIKSNDTFGTIIVNRAELNTSQNVYMLDKHGNSKVVNFVDDLFEINFLAQNDYLYLYTNDVPVAISNDEYDCSGCESSFVHCCESSCFTISYIDSESLTGDENDTNIFYVGDRCSYESLICGFKSVLARPILFHTIGLFYKEKWLSSNLDYAVKGSKDEAERMYVEYLFGATDVESQFSQSIKQAIKSVVPIIQSSNSSCVRCKGTRIISII